MDLRPHILKLKATVQTAAEHPFVPTPARLAIVQAGAVIELMATELHRLTVLLQELQARESRRLGA